MISCLFSLIIFLWVCHSEPRKSSLRHPGSQNGPTCHTMRRITNNSSLSFRFDLYKFVISAASSVEAPGPSEQLESGSPCHWARSEPVALAPSANGGQACIEAGYESRSFFRIESPTNDITHMSPCPWHCLSSCWQDHILQPSIHLWPVWCARRTSDRLEFSCFLWTC